jgi:hypothetical protein
VDLLAQPIDAVELPITAATYSVRGGEAATLKQVFLIHAGDIGTDPPPGYALAVLKDDRPVFQTNDQLAVTGREADVITAAQLSPGRYRLRVAVTDAAGRGGSLEMPLSVGLRAGGPIQFSDLFVGHLGNRFTPATEATRGAPMGALIELYAADASTFAGVTVEFELRRSGTEAILAHSAARITATDLPGRRIADAAIEVAHIDPGAHTVSALISLGGAVIGKVSRAIQITR